MPTLFAQAADPAQSARSTQLVVAIAALIAAVMLLGLIIMIMRKRLLARDAGADAGRSFMEDLRRMRDRGEITQEEFDATRRRIIERAKQRPDADAPLRKRGPGGASE
ncbi:MAG: SHOCT domain-containing protein [Leptolyngbya sp. PLA1]|nr:SHOCT domain-containing protein [Leptolyngbya sp. PLA1]